MKCWYSDIVRFLAFCVIALTTGNAWGQIPAPSKAIAHIESLPRADAFRALDSVLDEACIAGNKVYKNMLASCEEMLSEPTWDTHNEQLFKRLIEHGSTASCLNENERMRSRLLLDVVRKNAPGSIAHNIEYETLDGNHRNLSDITTAYTLIYFNDPECFSCAKVKERLDTCTTLMGMVADSTLTVLGIYPYENTTEWRLEPFPAYIVNGWDFKQDVDGGQTYDLMTMPMFYLLDRDKRVLVKNEASLNRVLNMLARLKGMEYSDIESKLDAVFHIDSSR